jgi:hypothetical protein
MPGRTANVWAGRPRQPRTLRKSGSCIVLVLANPRSLVECRSGAPQSAESWEQSMKRPKRDPEREDRIHNEGIVDASPDEQAMSWYYYLESKISFPFQAKCLATKVVSPLRKGETVEVVRMAPDEVCEHDMLVLVRWQDRTMAAPLAQLTAVDPDESTAEAVGDWHYWVAQGYCL